MAYAPILPLAPACRREVGQPVPFGSREHHQRGAARRGIEYHARPRGLEVVDEPRLELTLIPRGPDQYNADAVKPIGNRKSGFIPEEVYGPVVNDFRKANEAALEQLRFKDLPILLPGCKFLGLRYGGFAVTMSVPPAPALKGLTSVMTRLDRTDLETLDTLISAGFASSRAEAIRWSLSRIRERPVYQQLRERVSELEALKGQF